MTPEIKYGIAKVNDKANIYRVAVGYPTYIDDASHTTKLSMPRSEIVETLKQWPNDRDVRTNVFVNSGQIFSSFNQAETMIDKMENPEKYKPQMKLRQIIKNWFIEDLA